MPEPLKAVQLNSYLGKWYEIARYENRFERGCEAVTAEYIKHGKESIRIINTCHKGNVKGPVSIAEGKARIVKNSHGNKLKVSFFGPFYLGNYWVLDYADDYSWSIVGEPTGRYLWLLVRNPHLSKEQKTMLWSRAKMLGYDTSMLREVQH